jgi:hypothetical protein
MPLGRGDRFIKRRRSVARDADQAKPSGVAPPLNNPPPTPPDDSIEHLFSLEVGTPEWFRVSRLVLGRYTER